MESGGGAPRAAGVVASTSAGAMRFSPSSWFTSRPAGILKIGISRSVPRGMAPGYRRLRDLEPGPWFNQVTPAEYHRRFMAQLDELDAGEVLETIRGMAGMSD